LNPAKLFFLDADDTLFDFHVDETQAFERSFAEFDLVAAPDVPRQGFH
jgi:FMN phosphatase YigB (HAD superfamily)